jgi:hypothetical protein
LGRSPRAKKTDRLLLHLVVVGVIVRAVLLVAVGQGIHVRVVEQRLVTITPGELLSTLTGEWVGVVEGKPSYSQATGKMLPNVVSGTGERLRLATSKPMSTQQDRKGQGHRRARQIIRKPQESPREDIGKATGKATGQAAGEATGKPKPGHMQGRR